VIGAESRIQWVYRLGYPAPNSNPLIIAPKGR
jgi:hypothetical protein